VSNSSKTLTPQHIRNARSQARCGGHPSVSITQYCEHVDCLLTEIEQLEAQLNKLTGTTQPNKEVTTHAYSPSL